MGETAEERRRRLALENLDYLWRAWNGRQGSVRSTDTFMYGTEVHEILERELVKEDVSLVKKYSKGTFKFVNEVLVERKPIIKGWNILFPSSFQ